MLAFAAPSLCAEAVYSCRRLPVGMFHWRIKRNHLNKTEPDRKTSAKVLTKSTLR